MTALLLLALGATCAECHREEAKAFEASRHARAFTVPVFAASYSHSKTTWCLRCHRPEGRPTAGLTCESCHRVVEPGGTHPKLAAVGCGECHEFNSPVPPQLEPVTYSDQPLQATVSEAGGRACSECHDAHAATGAHDSKTLQSAVRVEAKQTAEGVELTVTASAGHRFPTGDPFRRLELVTCEDPACTVVLERQKLMRHFGLRDGKWTKVSDASLGDGQSATLRFRPARFWRATYHYGDPSLEAALPAEEVALEVAHGSF